MKKILTSVWFAVAVGLLGFICTIGGMVLMGSPDPAPTETAEDSTEGTNAPPAEPDQTADAHPIDGIESNPIVQPPAPIPASLLTQVAEPGSLNFNNPEVTQLVEELRRERQALRIKEEQLLELQRQVFLEKAEIGSITQDFLRAKALIEEAMTNRVTVLADAHKKKLAELAKVYTNMPPSNAVAILNGMPIEDVARILEFMKERNKAEILENFATNELTSASGKATKISEQLRQLGPPADLPENPKITDQKSAAE